MRCALSVLLLLAACELLSCKSPNSELEPYDQPVEGPLFHDGVDD